MESGIYRITCLTNGRIYVGSAINLRTRKCIHWSDLRRDRHHSRFLQRSWNKHGARAFRFEAIEETTPAHLVLREQHYIDLLKPEFNTCLVAGSSLGFRHSAESRKRMSEKQIGRVSPRKGKKHTKASRRKMSKAKKGKPGFFAGKRHTEASRKKMSVAKTGARSPRARAVRQLTLEGREVAVFSTLREAKDTTGVSVENIQNVLTGRGKTAGGYRWEDAAR